SVPLLTFKAEDILLNEMTRCDGGLVYRFQNTTWHKLITFFLHLKFQKISFSIRLYLVTARGTLQVIYFIQRMSISKITILPYFLKRI
ncbi:MAG TPA: hypothetical protein VHO70_03845, partial [Chitinispirillaceae bacterium]|nr:hypothetical protein [Chitinispirillaceae bacterium]